MMEVDALLFRQLEHLKSSKQKQMFCFLMWWTLAKARNILKIVIMEPEHPVPDKVARSSS